MLRIRSIVLANILLAGVTLFLYWPVQDFDLISLDDSGYIINNDHIQLGVTWEGIKWAFTSFEQANWHPLTWISYMLDIELFGRSPRGYHWNNIQLHIINTLLLLFVLNLATNVVWPCCITALLFAIHPLHIESVAWVSERKDVLCCLFWFLSIFAYIRYTRTYKWEWYILLILFFILGTLSKPMIVTLPFVLILLDYWPLSRFDLFGQKNNLLKIQTIRTLLYEKIPLFFLSACSCAVTFIAQDRSGAVSTLEKLPIQQRLVNAIFSYSKYIENFFWPEKLSIYYPPYAYNLYTLIFCLGLLFLVTVFVIVKLKKYPYLATGWFWYIGTLVPVIGLVQVGAQGMADRYTYIPLIGIFIMLSWGLWDVLKKWSVSNVVLGFVTFFFVAYFIVFSWNRIGYWKNGETLFRHALEATGPSTLVLSSLGYAYLQQGRLDQALDQYNTMFMIDPDRVRENHIVGNIYAKKGDAKRAIFHFNKVLSAIPNFSLGYYDIARVYEKTGETEKAVQYLKKAIEIDPEFMDALYNLAWIYGANSKPEMRDEALAVQLAEKLCRLKKYKNPFALDVLAVAFANRGQFDKAISTAQKALEISKQNKMANLSTNIEKRLNLYKKNKPFRNPDKLTLPQKNCIENDFKNPTPNPSNKTYF